MVLYIALIHYPVRNRNGDIIVSAVTNLDLHDIARSAKTFGVKTFYVITPLQDQKVLINRLLDHWLNGIGGELNPNRREALRLIKLKDSFQEVKNELNEYHHRSLKVIATTAKKGYPYINISDMSQELLNDTPYLLVFGTAWGLSEEIIDESDYILEPILGTEEYNHLSVRAASAIIMYQLTQAENNINHKTTNSVI
ncbi:MAG: RNA methyltransferase [Desulfobacterales bacterium]|nr:RNA methyltransferase [Desulfobacterales bacterium]